jgi:hypothetical protein
MSASNRRSVEPPLILDGARVLEYAPFDERILASGASAVVGGVAVGSQNAAGLAIVEDLAKGGLFLLTCNADWETVAAVGVADVAGAKAQAEKSFPGAGRVWREFRSLTDAERAELESTRRFLRELAAGDHDV